MEKDIIPIKIRAVVDTDLPFIYNSWLQNYKNGSYFAKRIRDRVFYKFHHEVIRRILERSTSQTLIACDPENDNIIWGYLVTEPYEKTSVLHYAYVKEAFRNMGIAKRLLDTSEVQPNKSYASHQTIDSEFVSEKFPEMLYCPYLL